MFSFLFSLQGTKLRNILNSPKELTSADPPCIRHLLRNNVNILYPLHYLINSLSNLFNPHLTECQKFKIFPKLLVVLTQETFDICIFSLHLRSRILPKNGIVSTCIFYVFQVLLGIWDKYVVLIYYGLPYWVLQVYLSWK